MEQNFLEFLLSLSIQLMISLFTALASIHLSLSIKELNKTEPMNAFCLKEILIFQSIAYRQLEIHQV